MTAWMDDEESLWLQHLAGGQIRYRSVGGLRTRSLEAGEGGGPAILFLHGTGGHAESFIRNVVPLAGRGFSVFAIDMIGHGYTDKPPTTAYRLSDYVRHVADFLGDIGVGPVHLVGESLGGWVAMRVAIDRPELVHSVGSVVGGGLAVIPPTEQELAGWQRVLDLSRQACSGQTLDEWRKRMRWLVADPDTMPMELVRTRAKIFEGIDEATCEAIYSVIRGLLDGTVEGRLTDEQLRRINVPCLYLWTDHNPTSPLDVAQKAFEMTPTAKMEVLTECGHWPQFEAADRFNGLVADFVNAVEANVL